MRDRTTGGLAAVAGGLVIFYLLSPPFVVWIFVKLGWDEGGEVLRFLYAPLIRFYEFCPPYKVLIDAIFKILLP